MRSDIRELYFVLLRLLLINDNDNDNDDDNNDDDDDDDYGDDYDDDYDDYDDDHELAHCWRPPRGGKRAQRNSCP